MTRPTVRAKKRHAEIAGAGIAGLVTATALAQRGWSVRLHERAPQLRDVGVSNSLWENGQRVLEEIGALEGVRAFATRVDRYEVLDENLEHMRYHKFNESDERAIVVLRVYLHRVLVDNARRAGVDIVTSSEAIGASPEGFLVMANGDRCPADLVVGCDGYHSKVRDSLSLASEVGFVTDAYIGRTTVARDNSDQFETIREFWVGSRRIGVLSCGPVYFIFLCAPENCPINEEEVRTGGIDRASWITAFPHLADYLGRADSKPVWGRYPLTRCKAWSVGHAAILGDSAHSMPPTLAQGAGCAMVSALTLAQMLDGSNDIPAALARWEQAQRPVVETTQRWSSLYITLSKRWPGNILDMRSKLIRDAMAADGVQAQFLAAMRQPVARA